MKRKNTENLIFKDCGHYCKLSASNKMADGRTVWHASEGVKGEKVLNRA